MSHQHAKFSRPPKRVVSDQLRQQSRTHLGPHPQSSTLPPFRSAFPLPFQQRQATSNTFIPPTNTRISQYEETQVLNKPASYESIVYNPDTKEASSEFSRTNFWEIPDVVVHDKAQREEGKNSLITTSSRVEYTPNFKSLQTPLREIKYQNSPAPARTQIYRNHEENTSPQLFGNQKIEQDEVEEEELQNQEEDGDDERGNEELNEEEEEEVESTEGDRYPVNLENNPSPFAPFENEGGGTDDFYGQVLGNIESVFNDEQSSFSAPVHENHKPRHLDGVGELLPQFEQNSFENLQNQERNEELNENGEDYVEDNEELAEEEEGGDESKTVVQQKPALITHKPENTLLQKPVVGYGIPKNHRPEENLNSVRESPFPNVKILREKPLIASPPSTDKPAFTFSPWLPTAIPTNVQPSKPIAHFQPQHKIHKEQSAPPQIRKKPNPQNRSYHSESKPYKESTKTTINKSWSTYKPEENDESSYHSSWKEESTIKPEKGRYRNGEKSVKETQEGEESRTRVSSKVPRHLGAALQEQKDSLQEESKIAPM